MRFDQYAGHCIVSNFWLDRLGRVNGVADLQTNKQTNEVVKESEEEGL